MSEATSIALDTHESIDDIDLSDLNLFENGLPADVFRTLREKDPVHWTPPPSEWANTADPGGYWAVTSYDGVVRSQRTSRPFRRTTAFF